MKPGLEKGQLIMIDQSGRKALALTINCFPEHLLVCVVTPLRDEKLRPVVLRNCQVINCQLEMDLFINLLSLQVIEKSSAVRIIGQLHDRKLYEILRHLDWLVLGRLQRKRERRYREEQEKWV